MSSSATSILLAVMLAANGEPDKRDFLTVKGRILGPDGKPIQGARLFAARRSIVPPFDKPVVALAQTKPTDDAGRFDIQIRKPGINEYVYLIAHAAGFGVDWIALDHDDSALEATLRLVKDVPISGRVVNTEGRPVSGVSVSLAAVMVPLNENLDDYLNGWHGGLVKIHDTLVSPKKRLEVPLDAIGGAATTDERGRFTLQGAGGERIAVAAISGNGVAHSMPYVITRPGFDAESYNALLRKDEAGRRFVSSNRFLGLHAPTFTFVAEAGKTIEGVIKDVDTGKPLAGCRVVPLGIGSPYASPVVSNAQGKYRLEGVPKSAAGYQVWAFPPPSSAHLRRKVGTADTAGFTKVRLDIELVQGAIVAGRVVDKRTGKGVRCYFECRPLPDNKFYRSKPGFDQLDTDGLRETEGDDEGRFRIVAIPGKSLLMALVMEGEKLAGQKLCVYRGATPDPDHKDLFKADGATWRVALAGNLMMGLDLGNAVKVLDAGEYGETRVELSVDPGATARIALQDADGKPLAGAWTVGLTDVRPSAVQLPEATATVYALNPNRPRTLAFLHADTKLGGTATLRGDEKEPVVVKLAPLGQVSGRLLDGDGNPLEGVEVSILAETAIGRTLYRYAAPAGTVVASDKEGRFRIDGLVPEMRFMLSLRRGRTVFLSEPRLGFKHVKPGETLDLGSVRVKPAR